MKRGCAIFLVTCFLALAGLAENPHLSKAKAEQILRQWLEKRMANPSSRWWQNVYKDLAISIPREGSVLRNSCQKEQMEPMVCILKSQKYLEDLHEAELISIAIRDENGERNKNYDFMVTLTDTCKNSEIYFVDKKHILLSNVLPMEFIAIDKISSGYGNLPANRGSYVTFTYRLRPSKIGQIFKKEELVKSEGLIFINPGGQGWQIDDSELHIFGGY